MEDKGHSNNLLGKSMEESLKQRPRPSWSYSRIINSDYVYSSTLYLEEKN